MKACVIHLLSSEVDLSIYFEVQAAFENNFLLVLLVFHTPSCVFVPLPHAGLSDLAADCLYINRRVGAFLTQIHQE